VRTMTASRMTRRLEALETRTRGGLDHLSDAELGERIVSIMGELERHGLALPPGWEADIAADPLAFMESIKPELVALKCAA
jgi:hypothetical protein